MPSPENLWRIGRGNPGHWPDRQHAGGSRFDDPRRQFRVLETGERRACVLESLAVFRPGLLAARERGAVPADWFETRHVARLAIVEPDWRGLDLRAPEALAALRRQSAPGLAARGYRDFDASHALSQDDVLRQRPARRAVGDGYGGVLYGRRLGPSLMGVALFKGSSLRVDPPRAIALADPDLLWAAGMLGLTLPADRGSAHDR